LREEMKKKRTSLQVFKPTFPSTTVSNVIKEEGSEVLLYTATALKILIPERLTALSCRQQL
jgi:hypothetical protein